MEKNWVIILHNTGKLEAWRDYDQIWGSAIYEVIGYFTGSHKKALANVLALVPAPLATFCSFSVRSVINNLTWQLFT